MTSRTSWLPRFALSLIGFACATASLQFYLTLPGFAPIYKSIDLERRPALLYLKRGFSTRPHAQYKGVIHTQNKDDETVIQIEGLPAQRYLVRFKSRFPSTNHHIAVFLNDRPLGVAVPKQAGVAQKFKFYAKPDQIRQDTNQLRFVHRGVRAAVNYELLEFRNYWLTSETGNVRIYFDGPWIGQALHASFWQFPLMAALWALVYAALGALAMTLLSAGLRVRAVTAVKVATGSLLIPVVGQLLCYTLTLLTPITIWVTPVWFIVATLVTPLVLCLLLAIASLLRAVALSTWFVLVNTWFVLLRAKTPVKGVAGFAVLLWYGIVACVRWLRGDLAYRTFLAFMVCYIVGGLFLMLDWRDGAERLDEWAFGFLIVALSTFGLQHIRVARASGRGARGGLEE